MRRINFSIVFILLAGVFWGMLGMFTRFLSDSGITDPEKLFVRCGVSFVVIFLYLLCRNRSLLKISLRDIWMFLGSGIMSVGSFCLVYFYTVAHIDVSIAAVLTYTSPAFIICLSAVFFKERITLIKILSIVLTVIGCVFVSGVTGGVDAVEPRYIASGVLSGFLYSLNTIFGTVALRRYHPLTVTLYTFLFAALTALPFMHLSHLASVAASGSNWLLMLSFALVTAMLPYSLYITGLKKTEPGTAAVCATLDPVTAAVLGALVLGEPVSLSTLLGIIFVLSGIVVVNLPGHEAPKIQKCGKEA